jgi:hypothetical protein
VVGSQDTTDSLTRGMKPRNPGFESGRQHVSGGASENYGL